jgi:hypothetical protein
MCWNATVSLQSFLIGTLAIFVGIRGGLDPTLLFFCATITLMQGIEAVAWSYLDHPVINELVSRAAAVLLWVQPLASIQTLRGSSFSSYHRPLSMGYVVLSLLELFWNPVPSSHYRMHPKKGHLEWKWIQSFSPSLFIYFLFLLLPLFLVPNPLLLFFVFLTLGISLYAYGTDNTWGSLWCWQVNGIAIAILGWKILFT